MCLTSSGFQRAEPGAGGLRTLSDDTIALFCRNEKAAAQKIAAASLCRLTGVGLRAVYYVVGMLFCAAGVSAMFRTYISPEVYELFVKEASAHFGVNINRFKTGYDCVSCLVGVAMSFLAFGLWHFEGVKWGTILCALVNGWIIGRFSAFYEKHWTFYDRFDGRRCFVPDAGARQ